MYKIKDITAYLEGIAPIAYQESYDNAGLLVGNANDTISKVLITLDITEAVVEEAIDTGCNLIIAHHPIIFKGLKKLTGTNYVERTVIKAIKNEIALYAIHTNLDKVKTGVNKKIAEKIGLTSLEILDPVQNNLLKLVTFVPTDYSEKVILALNEAGAGQIGQYKNCSFTVTGTGTFEPNDIANPFLGKSHTKETVTENRIEVILPAYKEGAVMHALLQSHPYEEVAYYITKLENKDQETGAGMTGLLETPVQDEEFLRQLKVNMDLKVLKHTHLPGKKIKKVALCGGSGSFLIKKAIAAQADVFISADFKYHDFFEHENKIIIVDIGHYESEVYTKDLIFELLNKNFTNIALNLSKELTNPISYL